MENTGVKPATTWSGDQGIVWKLMMVGAVVLIILCIREYLQYRAEPTMQTQFGEIKTQQLPDGTGVMLNAHSTLTINKEYNTKDREVWMKGEAFFTVKQTPGNRRFVVHAARYDITGTGSTFNMVNRNNEFNILVEQGSVAIHPNNINTGNETMLKPGEYAMLSNQQMIKRQIEVKRLLAWKEKKVFFTNAGLPEVAAFIEAYYGMKVAPSNNVSMQKTVDGELPNHNIGVLLHALEVATGYGFTVKNNEVVVTAVQQ